MEKTKGLEIEEDNGALAAQDVANADAVRNRSESTTLAGSWRLVEQMLARQLEQVEQRDKSLRQREQLLLDREAASYSAVREAECQARAAAAAIIEEASLRVDSIIRAAIDEAAQLRIKASVDAGAMRQAAQDHLVAGISLADAARMPAPSPPSAGQMIARLGEVFIANATGLVEKMMVANPEATARIGGAIAEAVGQGSEAKEGPPASPSAQSLRDVDRAYADLSEQACAEFMRSRGVSELHELTLTDCKALLELAREKGRGSNGAH